MIPCCSSCASAHREPPVLGCRDHVAHVEVVRHDPGAVEQREAQVEQLRAGRSLTPRMQHALVAHVAHAGLEHRARRLGHQRGDRLRGVDVGVDREPDAAGAGGGRRAAPCRPGPRPAASAAAGPSAPSWPAGCRGCSRSRAARRRRPPAAARACSRRRRRRPRRRARRACGAGSRASRPSRSSGLRDELQLVDRSGWSCRPGPCGCSGRSTAGRWAAARRAPWWGSGASGPRPPTSRARAASPGWRTGATASRCAGR